MNQDTVAEAATRVALLARKGVACERLQAALKDAGADVVLVSDPSQTDAAGVRNAGAQAILIALEPAVEDVLDRYDALLADPTITVIFDEADLAAQREGWDAARWSRHLAAKLNRHEQVLPPGAELEAALAAMAPPPPRYERPEHDGDISAVVVEADLHALELPRDLDVTPRVHPSSMFDPVAAEMDSFELADIPAFGELVLEGDASPTADDAPAGERFRRDLDDLQLRIADMQLEDAPPPRPAVQAGAVLVLAGIGGPDAVRQLLAELPAGFPRAVLIQQRLEGGRHDKLVRQMQRATPMPVALAEAGMALQPAHVYVLPAEFGLEAGSDGQVFRAAEGTSTGDALLAQLPAGDSAVLLLSGSDVGAVDAAMNHSQKGALVAGQSADGCFDATAPEAAVARGAQAGTPAQLAKMLASRWPS
jgi:chemosensory pili system protein ChpB (putative protein-glutamate methylesterase)